MTELVQPGVDLSELLVLGVNKQQLLGVFWQRLELEQRAEPAGGLQRQGWAAYKQSVRSGLTLASCAFVCGRTSVFYGHSWAILCGVNVCFSIDVF